MLTKTQLEKLRNAYNYYTPETPVQVRQQLGDPSDDAIIAAGLEHLQSTDRNVRVLALRVLANHPTVEAMHGILRGLTDPERRVRDVAVQSSVHFVQYASIADQLGMMATDAGEKRKIRERALHTLLGVGAPIRPGPLPQAVISLIEPLIARADYRERIMHGLVQIDECESVGKLLRRFVADGIPEEVAFAQKALSGYRMVNIGQFAEGPAREAILQSCELASGRVFYWVPRIDIEN